jgi:hypothetical protein
MIGDVIMEGEKSASMDQITNQNCFHAERPDTNDDSGTLMEKSLHTPQNCPEVKPAKVLVFFYLLAPIVILALYFIIARRGSIGIMYHSTFVVRDYIDIPSRIIHDSAVCITPLYILLAVWRGFYGLPFAKKTKTICSIVSFSIWAAIFIFLLYDKPIVECLKESFENIGPFTVIGASLYFAAMIKACNAILGYEKTKHSFKIDVISSTALLVAYYFVYSYFVLRMVFWQYFI